MFIPALVVPYYTTSFAAHCSRRCRLHIYNLYNIHNSIELFPPTTHRVLSAALQALYPTSYVFPFILLFSLNYFAYIFAAPPPAFYYYFPFKITSEHDNNWRLTTIQRIREQTALMLPVRVEWQHCRNVSFKQLACRERKEIDESAAAIIMTALLYSEL